MWAAAPAVIEPISRVQLFHDNYCSVLFALPLIDWFGIMRSA